MTNLILLSVAIFLAWVILPFAFIFGVITSAIRRKTGKYWLGVAIAIDAMGGIVGAYLFNVIFVKKDGYMFGKEETISSVIGRNKLKDTLTSAGVDLYLVLNKIQPNHCENSILNKNI